MKKYLFLSLIISVLFLLGSCSSVKGWDITKLDKSEYPAVIDSAEAEMKLAVDKVEPDAENVPVTIINLSDKEYGYGYEPRLEVRYNGEWYVIPLKEGASWHDLLIILSPGGVNNETFPLAGYYGTLPAGTYRFVKVLYAGENKLPISAEFTVDP